MNLDCYYTFIVLAKYQNYRKASEELFITQPSVFKQIKKLEEFLRVNLFETVGKHIVLTKEGQTFLPIAKDLIQTYEAGIERNAKSKKQLFISTKCSRYTLYSDLLNTKVSSNIF